MRPSRDVAARTRQRGDQPTPNRIRHAPDDDGDRRGGVLGSQGRWRARGEDHVNFETNKLSREFRQPVILSFGGPDLNGDVLALDPAEIAEPFRKPPRGACQGRRILGHIRRGTLAAAPRRRAAQQGPATRSTMTDTTLVIGRLHPAPPPPSPARTLMPISRYIVVAVVEVLLGLRAVPGAAVERAEAEVAVGDERAHAELARPAPGRRDSGLRPRQCCRGWMRGDLAEKPKRPGLVASLSSLAGEVERALRRPDGPRRNGRPHAAPRRGGARPAPRAISSEAPRSATRASSSGRRALVQPVQDARAALSPSATAGIRERIVSSLRQGARLARSGAGLCEVASQGMNVVRRRSTRRPGCTGDRPPRPARSLPGRGGWPRRTRRAGQGHPRVSQRARPMAAGGAPEALAEPVGRDQPQIRLLACLARR